MKIDLTICGVDDLANQTGKPWTHVVSIWDKAFLDETAYPDQVKEIAPKAELLFSYFDDTNDAIHPRAPRLQDIERILEFTSHLPAEAKLLVHCRAGISRSTATAYAILCQHSEPGTEASNLLHVKTLRPFVAPNRLIIELSEKVLNRKGSMLIHLPIESSPPPLL